MARGIKSKFFGCYWQSMFLTAMIFDEKASKAEIMQFKSYYNSFKFILPCRFCREFIKNTLEKEAPLDFSSKNKLLKSIYIWKDMVNKKLISQGCNETQESPPFKEVKAKLQLLYAKCNKTIGKCL